MLRKGINRFTINLSILLITCASFFVIFHYHSLFIATNQHAPLLNRLDKNTPETLSEKLENDVSSIKMRLPLSSATKYSIDVLSSIDFINPFHLHINLDTSNIIPMIVLSHASNIELRDTIRRTWASDTLYKKGKKEFQIYFLVGTDDFMTRRINTEQYLFDDVINVLIPDSYSFSAYKELSAMIWVKKHFPQSEFYIKTEENVIMNMYALVDNLLPAIEGVKSQSLIIGWYGKERVFSRGNYQKFTDAIFSDTKTSLDYPMNLFYVVTLKAATNMIESLDGIGAIEYPGDIFVTGVLRDAAFVEMKNLANSMDQYTYTLSQQRCDQAFENNPKLIFCVPELRTGWKSVITDYFTVWDKLYMKNQLASNKSFTI